MRRVEREEEITAVQSPDKQCLHLCIINLVIGTLYCAKVGSNSAMEHMLPSCVVGGVEPLCIFRWGTCRRGLAQQLEASQRGPCAGLSSLPLTLQGNYEFGISRIIKSLEPYDKKLETDTWWVGACSCGARGGERGNVSSPA